MLNREERIKQAQSRITAKALSAAENVAAHWGVPVGEACSALEAAAMKLRVDAAAGKPWPAESQRLVSNGTPDQTVRSMASALIHAQVEQPTAEAVARTLQARGVRRRRVDLLRLVNEARKPAR